jgi:hypothetical protein
VIIRNNAGSGDSRAVLFIYGPNSTVDLNNNVIIHGSVIGKEIIINNNVDLLYNNLIGSITPTTLQGYTSHSYRECTTGPTGATPDTGC